MADYRVIDIETVPDLRVWTPPPSRYVWTRNDPGFGEMFMSEPHLQAEAPFPPPQAHRIVSIAHLDLTSDDSRFYFFDGAGVRGSWSADHDPKAWDVIERELIAEFVALQLRDEATLVTWNGRCFDLPVINMRAFRHGVPMSWFYKQDGMRYRYSEVGHCDLMDVFSDYGAARNMKLGDVARCMGLPGKFGDVSGGSVEETVYSKTNPSNFKDVNRYCLSDVFQTALLFVRSRYHKGMISREEYNRAVSSFSISPDLQVVMNPDFNLSALLLP